MTELNIKEHFQVPEGYFDNLADQVMKSLPEQEFQPMKVAKKGRIIPMWTRYAAAACVGCVVMVSAFTAFYHGADQTAEQKKSPIAVVTTTIADSSKKVLEAVNPTTAKEKPVLAKAEKLVAHDNIAVNVVTKTDATSAPKTKVENKEKKSSSKQSYDMDVNTGYDQNEMERAAMYMGIDHQDMCEMMYEGL